MAVQFLEALQKSELLTPEQIAATVRERHLSPDQDPKEIAKAFVQSERLTLFQANQLLHGHTRGFFIDDYKIREILGTGGMGWVYIAEHEETGQLVAIKVLSDRHKHDAGIRARFQLEARAGLMLDDPHIVKTHKFGHIDDLYGDADFMVMEFFQGINLQDLLRQQGPLPWKQACDVIRQTAIGLHHAHEHGMVHRDIKPANLLIDHDGNVKILDFGLASIQQDADGEFSLAMIFGHQCLGTDDYIAPEQIRNSHTVDGRADLYSLGCTFYQLLTGRVPFREKTTSAKLHAQQNFAFPNPHQEVHNLPAAVSEILLKMVAKDPDQRWANGAELAAALESYSEPSPVQFDFRKILGERAVEARKRLQREQASSAVSRPSSVAQRSSSALPMTASRASRERETEVASGADTRPQRSSVTLTNPYADAKGNKGRDADLDLGTDSPDLRFPDGIRPNWKLVPQLRSLGPAVPLERNRYTIGRSPECEIQIDSQRVSQQHCQLLLESSGWRVKNLSKNGTKINGTAITDQLLWPGDRITIADQYHFEVQLIDQQQAIPMWIWIAAGVAGLAVIGALAAYFLM